MSGREAMDCLWYLAAALALMGTLIYVACRLGGGTGPGGGGQ